MTRPFDNLTIIGAGILGSQIAMLGTQAGYQVITYDTVEDALTKTIEKIRRDLHSKNITPFIPWEAWDSCLAKIQSVTDLDQALKDADLVIEAVPETLELKQKVWTDLGQKSKPSAILATNSSSMPVSRMEDSGGRPEKSLNIHFYFPLQGVNHVDIMGGSKTTKGTIDTGIAFVRSIGCLPLTVKKELLGFCFNRVWRSVKRETLYMWGNDFVDFQDVDRGWMVFTGMNEGPFAMMDKVGLDVVHDIEMVYYNDSGDPKDKPPKALKDKVDAGHLGVKSGQGFYTYPNPEYLAEGFLDPKKD